MKGVSSYINLNETGKIKLDGNESYFDTNKEEQLMVSMTIGGIELNRYPEDDALELRENYGKYAGVEKENIIAGNGSDEMIALIMGAYLEKGKKVLTLNPDFSMYDFYSSIYGADCVKMKCERDGSFKVENFIEVGIKEEVDLIIFSNPNNPTGYALDTEEIRKILECFKDVKVVVDEAYYEFHGETVIPLIEEYNNLIVTRTLSKAWGLAALRIGFLISNKDCVGELRKYKVPYNISTISQLIAKDMIKDKHRVVENSKAIIENREELYKELKQIQEGGALEIQFYPSKGNYIYGRSPYKSTLIKTLRDRGIIIRNFINDDSFRITVGSNMQNKKLIEAIKEVFIYYGQ